MDAATLGLVGLVGLVGLGVLVVLAVLGAGVLGVLRAAAVRAAVRQGLAFSSTLLRPSSCVVMVIGLDRPPGPERSARLMASWRGAGLGAIPITRVPAVDTRDATDPADLGAITPAAQVRLARDEARGFRETHRDLTRGAVGCFLSHIAALRRFVERTKAPCALVLEDDCRVPPDFCDRLARAVRTPGDWDLLLMNARVFASAEDGSLLHFWYTNACVWTRRGARRALDAFDAEGRFDVQYDTWLSRLATVGTLRVMATADGDAVAQEGATSSTVQTPVREADDAFALWPDGNAASL